jgi:hypothetical protein
MSVTYAIRHALEVLGDSGFDEDIRSAALAELDDVEARVRKLTEALRSEIRRRYGDQKLYLTDEQLDEKVAEVLAAGETTS